MRSLLLDMLPAAAAAGRRSSGALLKLLLGDRARLTEATATFDVEKLLGLK